MKHTAEGIAGHLFDLLVGSEGEFTTRQQMADALSQRLGCTVTVGSVMNGLQWSRDNAAELGWTIPNVGAGRSGSRQYRVTPIDPAWGLSQDESDAVEAGWRTSVAYSRTRVQRALEPLKLAAGHAHSKALRRELRGMVMMGEMLVTAMSQVSDSWDDE